MDACIEQHEVSMGRLKCGGLGVVRVWTDERGASGGGAEERWGSSERIWACAMSGAVAPTCEAGDAART